MFSLFTILILLTSTYLPFLATTTSLVAQNLLKRSYTVSALLQNPKQIDSAEVAQTYGKIPLSFEENVGQTDESVKFISRGNGYTLFLTGTEAVFSLAKDKDGASSVIRMQLVDSQANPKVYGVNKLEGKANYFIGTDPENWKTDVSTYKMVQYNSVYPGIDLVYYGNQGQLEYDFIVSPGADPGEIVISYAGVDKLEVDSKGDLILSAGGEQFRMQKPFAYQEVNGVRKEVTNNYTVVENSKVALRVDQYDNSKPLIIDPVLVFSTYLGGSYQDEGMSIAADAAGNTYITGYTDSPNFPTSSPYQSSKNGVRDIFIAKLNSSGTALIYSTYLGGTSSGENPQGIAVDSLGNAYIAGHTNSTDFPLVNPLQSVFGGWTDVFITKLSPSGSSLIYSTYLGGNKEDANTGGIAIDTLGNVYISGYTNSYDFPTVNALQPTLNVSSDAFVSKLNSSGTALIYSTYLGGGGYDIARGVAIDSSGNVYVTGDTKSSNFPTVNPLQTDAPYDDAFVTKIDSSGSSFIYSTYLGGDSNDSGRDIAADSSGNAYVTGYTTSYTGSNFPLANPLQAILNGTVDAFVTKIDSSGTSYIYSTYLGGSSQDRGWSISADTLGNAYVAGQTGSYNFPTVNPVQSTLGGGGADAFVTKINPVGSTLIFSTYLGGTYPEDAYDIAVDNLNNIYVTGQTGSVNFPTVNAFQPSKAGRTDVFITKIFDQPPNQPPTVDAGGPYSVDEGETVQVTATGQDPENGPLVYVWDLDNDGSFETPGQTVAFSAIGLDGPNSHTIAVQVSDDGNLTATHQATVNISNVVPIADFSVSPSIILLGESSTLIFSNQFDPGVDDTNAGFLYSYDCTNDGIFELLDGSATTFACTYSNSGVYTAKGQIKDKDGGYSYYTVAISVQTSLEAISDLVDLVYSLNLQNGIENSLDAKLDSALNALDDINQNNDVAAINSLNAFINAVEAQRDNKITSAEADELIALTQRIINSL